MFGCESIYSGKFKLHNYYPNMSVNLNARLVLPRPLNAVNTPIFSGLVAFYFSYAMLTE